jgi:lipoprotein-releasing system permease protein
MKGFAYFRNHNIEQVAHEFFIARRIFLMQNEGKKVSRPIVRISMISIALAIVVNLLTIGVVIGFQKEVREKVSGFSSHALLMNAKSGDIIESDPIRSDQAFYPDLLKNKAILSLNKIGYKPVLFQSDKNERKITTINGKDSVIIEQNIDGAILKGVENNYDWTFLTENIKEGRIPNYSGKEMSNEILISSSLANRLQYKLGDTVRAYFVKKQPIKRFFHIVGIYHTGLEEFDKKTVIGDLRQVQELSDWGVRASLEVVDTISDGYLIVKADIQGGSGYFEYDWGKGFGSSVGLKICPTNDTSFRLIVRERPEFLKANNLSESIPDTAFVQFKITGDRYSQCSFKLDDDEAIERSYWDEDGNHFSIQTANKTVEIKIKNGRGNSQQYIGGIEVRFKEWNTLDAQVEQLKRQISFTPNEHDEILRVMSVKEDQEEIFVWLEFLDLNVLIILILMILIGIVNVGAALMVMILVKTSFIGMMKALGSANWPLRKIFLYQSSLLIGKGILWGNIIGLGLCFLQKKTGLLTLNPEVYYLSEVPIEIGLSEILVLNLVTMIVCLSAMIIPSNIISKIQPSKAIKFE